MIELLAAAIIAGSFVGALSLLRPFIDRLLKLMERRLEMDEQRFKSRVESDPIPIDLFAGAMRHSEEWAREDAIKLLYQKRAELGSWNAVRTSSIAIMENEQS